jgi:hypothetical protein
VRVGVAGGFGEIEGELRWQALAPEEELDLVFRGSQLDLGRLLAWVGIEHGVSGLASFTGGLRGELDHPRGSWALGLEQVEVLGQLLGDGAATVDLVDGRFGVNGLRFDQGLEASARWTVMEDELEGRLRWPQMPVRGLGATAIKLVGRAHFDDPYLLDKTFIWR